MLKHYILNLICILHPFKIISLISSQANQVGVVKMEEILLKTPHGQFSIKIYVVGTH